jgi:hypothetical protein
VVRAVQKAVWILDRRSSQYDAHDALWLFKAVSVHYSPDVAKIPQPAFKFRMINLVIAMLVAY